MIDTPNDESSFYSSVEYCGVKKVPNRLIGKKFCGDKKGFIVLLAGNLVKLKNV